MEHQRHRAPVVVVLSSFVVAASGWTEHVKPQSLNVVRRVACGPVASVGYDNERFAGRYALGKNLPAVHSKQGFAFERANAGEVRVLGGACSEVLGGANLAKLLQNGYDLEVKAMEALRQSQPAPALSVHTSAGVPPELDQFLSALEPHLPTESKDWCVNLQAEGASAVHAAIDMGLQVFQSKEDLQRPGARVRVACGASSYHGPASTSPGGGIPIGEIAKGLTHPVRYPVPSPFLRHRGEDEVSFHARMLTEFEGYLDTYGHEIGVLLVEPQVRWVCWSTRTRGVMGRGGVGWAHGVGCTDERVQLCLMM